MVQQYLNNRKNGQAVCMHRFFWLLTICTKSIIFKYKHNVIKIYDLRVNIYK